MNTSVVRTPNYFFSSSSSIFWLIQRLWKEKIWVRETPLLISNSVTFCAFMFMTGGGSLGGKQENWAQQNRDETELDIKKGRHSGAYIIFFQKGFFVLCKKAWAPEWQGKCYQVRRMRRYHPKMHPWSQHKKVEDGTELDIKKEEITEPILFSPMKVEPDESASNELQPIDNVYLHNNTVHLYFCIVCNVSFTDKRIKTDWLLFSKCLRITYIGYNNGFHWYQFLALVQPLNSHTYRNKVTHFLYPSPTLTWLHRIISVTEQL